jgi:hypothetical protein
MWNALFWGFCILQTLKTYDTYTLSPVKLAFKLFLLIIATRRTLLFLIHNTVLWELVERRSKSAPEYI